MSLTNFLEKNADVRARFLAEFNKPEFGIESPLLAPPLTKSSGLDGTAFDYLLRFYVEKLNLDITTSREWIAEKGADRCPPSVAKKARRLVDEAKNRHRAFLKSKRLLPTPALIEAAVWLASLDTVFRCGFKDPKMFAPAPRALIEDLRTMLSLVPQQHFRAGTRCVLNPSFGRGSQLVGGADADLIIDDTLIDVKTSKDLTFSRDIFNQLVGYYILSCVGGMENGLDTRIKYLGVYYARYAVFQRIEVADCFAESKMPAFLSWFKQRARAYFPPALTTSRTGRQA